MNTRRLIAYLLILAIVAGLALVRIVVVRAKRRERRQAAKPIQIVADNTE